MRKASASLYIRLVVGLLCVVGLVGMYLFMQGTHYAGLIGIGEQFEVLSFSINKYIRYLINDLLTIGLIWAIFVEARYIKFAAWVLLFGLVVLVPAYLILKFNLPPDSRHALFYLHRITFNPVIMMLLIPAFFYQRWIRSDK